MDPRISLRGFLLSSTSYPLLINGTEKLLVKRDPASKKVVRLNESGEGDKPSLTQGAIARWPHDNCGINLGKLGTTPRQLPASK
jgi:hypothetical protein